MRGDPGRSHDSNLPSSRPAARRRLRPAGLLWLATTLVLIAVLPATAVNAQERGLLPEDMYRVVSVGSVEVSPDGSRVAFTVTEIDEEENTRHTRIWLQELEDGEPVGDPIPFTDPTQDSSSPRWSPDGSLLAFSSQRDDDQTIRFIRVGPPGGEAFRIEGVEGSPLFSPDGSRIAFLDDVEPEEADNEEDVAGTIAPDAITAGLDPSRFDGHVATHLRYKTDGRVDWLPHPEVRARSQLFVVPRQGGEPAQLTDLPRNVRNVEWTPDGEGFFFTLDPHEDDELHFHPSSDIHFLPAAGGDPVTVVSGEGSQTAPSVSPDGRWLAYLETSTWFDQTELMVVELGPDRRPAGEPIHLTQEWIYSPGSPSWTPDGDRIRFSAGVHGNTHLFEVPVGGGDVRAITEGDRTLSSISVSDGGRVMAFVSSDPVSPGDVHVARGDGTDEVRATSFNDALLSEVSLQPAERLTWTVSDGTDIEGWIIPPMDWTDDGVYPMVLSIHGGPHSVYRNSFSHLFQVLSGTGFYVLYINPRGSTTYGNDFKHAIHAGWGMVDEEDFVTGVEAALERHSDIDPDRLGVMGGSYGGYMTNWLTARTDLFAAGVTRASIANWMSLAKNTDSSLPHLPFDGPTFDQRELYRALSPISYVENVTAPTLVIHGENDYRTPLGEGEQWYGSLKKLGVPTEFVLYPRSAHGIREPWLAADSQARTRQWFQHWLIDEAMVVDGMNGQERDEGLH